MNLNDAWLKYMEIIAGNANWIRHAEQIRWRKICLKGISKHEPSPQPGNLSLVFHECWMCSSGPSAASVAYSWAVEVGRTSQAWRQKQNEADHTRLREMHKYRSNIKNIFFNSQSCRTFVLEGCDPAGCWFSSYAACCLSACQKSFSFLHSRCKKCLLASERHLRFSVGSM